MPHLIEIKETAQERREQAINLRNSDYTVPMQEDKKPVLSGESLNVVTLVVVGLVTSWLLYFGFMALIFKGSCLPSHLSELKFAEGTIDRVSIGRKGPSTLTIRENGKLRTFDTGYASALKENLGKSTLVGFVSSPLCLETVLHIETGGNTIQDFQQSKAAIESGSAYEIGGLLSCSLGLFALFLFRKKGKHHLTNSI